MFSYRSKPVTVHELGRELGVSPHFTLKKYAATQPDKDPHALSQVIEMLKKAGFQ